MFTSLTGTLACFKNTVFINTFPSAIVDWREQTTLVVKVMQLAHFNKVIMSKNNDERLSNLKRLYVMAMHMIFRYYAQRLKDVLHGCRTCKCRQPLTTHSYQMLYVSFICPRPTGGLNDLWVHPILRRQWQCLKYLLLHYEMLWWHEGENILPLVSSGCFRCDIFFEVVRWYTSAKTVVTALRQ